MSDGAWQAISLFLCTAVVAYFQFRTKTAVEKVVEEAKKTATVVADKANEAATKVSEKVDEAAERVREVAAIAAQEAKDAALRVEEVKKELILSNSVKNKKLDKILENNNGALWVRLKLVADLSRWKANFTHLKEDEVLADLAESRLKEHEEKQRLIPP